MQVCFVSIFMVMLGALPSDAITYYKERPHPPKLHYSHKHPTHYFQKPQPFHSHIRRPIPIHSSRPLVRPPPRPYTRIVKPTPPPFPPASWKTRFSAPVVKDTFHSPQVDYSPQSYVKDDDKGPIHTIPAPNLNPADRPAKPNPVADLEAVLRHGQTVQAKPTSTYQVTEDPSAYKPYSGSPSYFAPDPDPSLPTVEVPQTLDPQSQPSNGQVPLELYQQQHNGLLQQAYASGNSLSSQDLYNLLNGVGEPQQMTAALYQQYLQAATAHQPAAYQQVYTAGLLYPQQYQQQLAHQFSQQNFHPQFETFNYNEQTQESAHGSDSFPAASSLSVGVKRAVSRNTGNSGENTVLTDQKGFFEKERVGIINNQVDYEDQKSTEQKETSDLLNSAYFSSLPNKQAADTLATLAAAGNINNQIMRSPNHENYESRQQNIHQDKIHNNSRNNKQNTVRYETNSQRNNEIKEEINENDNIQQSINSHNQFSLQENRNEHSIRYEIENENNREPFRNHNVASEMINNNNKGQQSYNSQNLNEQNQPSNKNSLQSFSEDEYSDDEILDPSDKDHMDNKHIPNGIHVYGTDYYKNEKEEEQSYEDSDNDYTQEEEAEINKANTKTSTTMEKTISYNAHQNQLPFGTKLRPKRI